MSRRAVRRSREARKAGGERPAYRQLRNPFAPIEVLSADQIEHIHLASLSILEKTGIRIIDTESRGILREGGFDVDEDSHQVRLDRDGVLELVSKAPSRVSVRGRNPAKRVMMGEGYVAFTAVGGPPFVSDLEGGRRPGNIVDLRDFIRLTQMLDIIHIEGGCSVEPTDLPVSTRHLDFYLACCQLTDKPWKPLSIGVDHARDALEMAKILYGEDDSALAADPVFFINTNTNTPLVLDQEIAQGVLTFARAGQPICVTPFALAGAMAPVTMAGALALQNAETLAACALVQLVRPGCPYVYGSFTCNVDMRTGSPAFGTPEYTLGAQASGQMARRYNLPWRSSNVNTSNAPDAQAAYESQMSLWGAMTGHVSVLNQGAGWLEGGLVASFEKLLIDAEMLEMMAAWTKGLEVNSETIGLDAIAEVGPGGHFFGTKHTLERYENAFYSPVLSDWSNFESWQERGSLDVTMRAHRAWKEMLTQYQQPELDAAVNEALEDYVKRRKEKLGKG
ncbi:MAG: trimethylamine methyltransferase family protein [Acidiferrobacteraceae bacterium]|nr:trimethylamine methyltransferase family protein [Acidiferrobacteraceae bacterium]MBT3640208.1 trimethylamine methyltransferase family protein [Acidiferrobacteraceae bacterium]MBT3771176.1 trimethylamine methyltransferase family protein [Acidiferrobacteraceae bacterium]MBT4395319.1 trimethylamine methyltransferase family protein [Acidiferrobacteraceae bacterium]MBT4404809.1 trimethylamine methyltransferase family protein [Acidiferrobacteraceae bacterium]